MHFPKNLSTTRKSAGRACTYVTGLNVCAVTVAGNKLDFMQSKQTNKQKLYLKQLAVQMTVLAEFCLCTLSYE